MHHLEGIFLCRVPGHGRPRDNLPKKFNKRRASLTRDLYPDTDMRVTTDIPCCAVGRGLACGSEWACVGRR